jgi:hypothetical protein
MLTPAELQKLQGAGLMTPEKTTGSLLDKLRARKEEEPLISNYPIGDLSRFKDQEIGMPKKESIPYTPMNLWKTGMATKSEIPVEDVPTLLKPAKAIAETFKNTTVDLERRFQEFSNSLAGVTAETDQFGGPVKSTLTSTQQNIDRVAKGASLALGFVNAALTPITSLFSAGEQLPVVGDVVGVVNKAFGKTGEIASEISGWYVDQLPVSQEVKDSLRGPIEELAALTAQIGLGKITIDKAKLYLDQAKNKIKEVTSQSIDLIQKIPKIPETIKTATENVIDMVQDKTGSYVAKGRARAIDSLEADYDKWTGQTKPGQKALSKVEARTEAMNRAGTEGRTPQRVLAEYGTIPETEGTKFATANQAERIRNGTALFEGALQNALKEVQMATEPPRFDVMEAEAIARTRNQKAPLSDIESQIRDIQSEFALLKEKYGDAIDITELNKQKQNYDRGVKYDITKPFKKSVNYNIASAMRKTIEKTASEAGFEDVAQLNREIGDIMGGAEFLERLDGQTLKYGKIGKYLFMGIGASLGRTFVGKVIGALGGEMVSHFLMKADVAGPVKRLFLKNLENEYPQAYADTIKWMEKQGLERELRILLPEASYTEMGGRTSKSGVEIVPAPKGEPGRVVKGEGKGQFKGTFLSDTEKLQSQPKNLEIKTATANANKVSNIEGNNIIKTGESLTTQLSKEIQELKEIGKGELVKDPESLVKIDVQLSNNIKEILGLDKFDVSFTKRSLKHLIEKDNLGTKLIDSIPEILRDPIEIRNAKMEDRFLISKDISVTRDSPLTATALEVKKEGNHLIVSVFPTNQNYLSNFDLLWRSPKSQIETVPPSASAIKQAGSRGDISALREDQNQKGTKSSIANSKESGKSMIGLMITLGLGSLIPEFMKKDKKEEPVQENKDLTTEEILKGMSFLESTNDPDQIGDKNLKNKAYGEFQVRLPALKDVNEKLNKNFPKNPKDLTPEQNREVATLYLEQILPRTLKQLLKNRGREDYEITQQDIINSYNYGPVQYVDDFIMLDDQNAGKYYNDLKEYLNK